MTQVTPLPSSLMETCSPSPGTAKCFMNNNLALTGDGVSLNLSSNTLHPLSSLTEKEILSHALIREVVNKSKSNTIQHHVNTIPHETKLYKLPLQKQAQQFVFDAIPPNNQYFVSESSRKVNEIHHRLSDDRDLSQRLIQRAHHNMNEEDYHKQAKRPTTSHNLDRRVSISGLVSYNFNSVRARRSLGSIPDVSEQEELARKKQQMKKRNSCCANRQIRMMRRKPNDSNLHRIQMGKASTCDFLTPTGEFLRNLRIEKVRDERIYGESMQKLACIKQYMGEQKVDYEQALFIVDAVVNSQKKEVKKKIPRQKVQIDDQLELSKRKQALSRRKVTLRQLYFTE